MENIEDKFTPNENDYTGIIKHSLVDINSDKIPELLVKRKNDYLEDYLIYYFDKSSGKLITLESQYLQTGVGRGGFRGRLLESKEGNGLLFDSGMGGTGEFEVSRFTISGDKLVYKIVESYRTDQGEPKVSSEFKEIDWNNSVDLTAIENIIGKKMDSKSLINEEKKKGRLVQKGTIKVLDRNGVLNLQNIKDPNPYKDENTYVLAVFEKKFNVMAKSSGDLDEGNAFPKDVKIGLISLSTDPEDIVAWKKLNDKTFFWISLDSKEITLPSDTRLPLEEPSIKVMKLINE